MIRLFRTAALFVILIGLILAVPGSSYHFTAYVSGYRETIVNEQLIKQISGDASIEGIVHPPISCLYFDEPSFRNAVSQAKVYQESVRELKGGIVPHHLLASDMIASFWKTVAQTEYDLVVIIGPDHQKRGKSAVTTITSGFATLFGDVKADKAMADLLIQQNLVLDDSEVMEIDHSISSQIPFIRYYMPDTPVLPLLIKGNCSFDWVRALSDKIVEAVEDKRVLFVAAMDFSHYLSLEEANRMDEITEKAFRESDYESITRMTNDHLDSRPSALFMLYTMSGLKARSMEKWAHSNSDTISKASTGYTTSYFTFGFLSNAEETTVHPDIMENRSGTDNEEEEENQNEAERWEGLEGTAEPKDGREIHILAIGDIMLGRGVAQRLKASSLGYSYPFAGVSDLLKNADILFGNLEQPITNHEKSLDKRDKYILKSSPDAVLGLQHAGFNLLSLANNHILDYYEEGLEDTITILDEWNISHAGAGVDLAEARKPAIIEKNGLKIALLAYTDMAEVTYQGNPPMQFAAEALKAGVAPLRPEWICEDIRKVREQADILMISLHWGEEDSFQINDRQKKLARELCDAGADIILGHHPHWFQGIEIYNGNPIVYSLGNFIFDQPSPESKESFILEFTYRNTGTERTMPETEVMEPGSNKILTGITAIPIRTVDQIRVVPMKGDEAQELLQRQLGLSKELGTESTIEGDTLQFIIVHE